MTATTWFRLSDEQRKKTTTCTNKYGQAIIGKDKPTTVTDGKISAIVQNMEKLISFSWGQFRFVDSLQFLNASLDKLVNSTPRDAFRLTSALPHHELLMRKGVYPYEYMNDFARFDEKSLPPPSEFYSKQSNEHITDSAYKHAQEVWATYNCTTLGDYHNLYLQTDVLLLADVFENFRRTAMATYGLDPAHYYTLPGYSWDADASPLTTRKAWLQTADRFSTRTTKRATNHSAHWAPLIRPQCVFSLFLATWMRKINEGAR